jgi:hypothetical protein
LVVYFNRKGRKGGKGTKGIKKRVGGTDDEDTMEMVLL